MRRRNLFVWATVVVGTAVSLWACTRGGGNPAAPTVVSDAGQAAVDNPVRGAATVGPTSRPVGPGTRPIGPSSRPVGPGSGTPPPSGGGTPTPPGPTVPTQPPTGGNCTTTNVDQFALDTPLGPNAPGGFIVSDINVPNLGDNCRIRQVRVSLYHTDPQLSANPLGASVSHTAFTLGVRVLWDPLTLSGTSVGSSCADVIFEQGTAPTFPGEPPYSGLYSPIGLITSPQFTGFIGTNPAGTWTIRLGEASNAARLRCWRLQLQLQ